MRLLTGHDMKGFADHDWAALARPGEVAAIYMGKKSARFIQGRLLMHGADRATPITLVENASRPEQRIVETTLDSLPADLSVADMQGPVLTFYGLAPRAVRSIHFSNPSAGVRLMSRQFSPKVVTANALIEGDVIYQTATGWTRVLAEAEVLTDEADADLRLIEASQQTDTVVGAYLADVTPTAAGPKPAHFREEFRARGPSNHFHGKQALRSPHA